MRRPHLQEMFHELREMGLRTGMISNIISRSVVPHFLAEYGILDQMDCIVTSSETGIRKPDPVRPPAGRQHHRLLDAGPEIPEYHRKGHF